MWSEGETQKEKVRWCFEPSQPGGGGREREREGGGRKISEHEIPSISELPESENMIAVYADDKVRMTH